MISPSIHRHHPTYHIMSPTIHLPPIPTDPLPFHSSSPTKTTSSFIHLRAPLMTQSIQSTPSYSTSQSNHSLTPPVAPSPYYSPRSNNTHPSIPETHLSLHNSTHVYPVNYVVFHVSKRKQARAGVVGK